jgi:hypothetical protein
VLWRLLRNPRDEKILVVSATGNKSKEFVSQVKTLLAPEAWPAWLGEEPADLARLKALRPANAARCGGALLLCRHCAHGGMAAQEQPSRRRLQCRSVKLGSPSRKEQIRRMFASSLPTIGGDHHGRW